MKFASRLVQTEENSQREAMLREYSALPALALAHLLKDICLEGWSSDPSRALGASAALQTLSQLSNSDEVSALSEWASGLEELIRGRMELAIENLDRAQKRFLSQSKIHLAAATRISKLIALAMLGRYEDAIDCGLEVREIFRSEGDLLSLGKIEHNIGNIYFRRDLYVEAEKFQRSAREHFLAVNDQLQMAKIDNSLALTLAQQYKVKPAEQLYEQALARAEKVGLLTTQAEIESSIGTLALYQGHYNRALDFLERSRRKYAELNRPHILAMTEQEIADAYLELNLAAEALDLYERVVRRFSELGMHAEEARALANQAQAEIMLGNLAGAQHLLTNARQLFIAEGNMVGAALVEVSEAQLLCAQARFAEARTSAGHAASVLAAAASPRRYLFAKWLEGEAARAGGASKEAEQILDSALDSSKSLEQPDIAARCLTSLGLLSVRAKDVSAAERHFLDAMDLIEQLRAPLPAEEFRTAFFADKLVPYHELVKLCLAEGACRTIEAFNYLERGRSRALVDALGGRPERRSPSDPFETETLGKLEELRGQLSYFYNQLNLPSDSSAVCNPQRLSTLHHKVRRHEMLIAELTRQLAHPGGHVWGRIEEVVVDSLQRSLGDGRALVEFAGFDDELLAFIITNERVEVFRRVASEAEIARDVSRFRFQIDSLRHGSGAIRNHLPLLAERTRKHLHALYRKILSPLEEFIGDRHLVIVPQGSLHYLPFHALYDGANYLIETREVSYSPSAVVLQHCLQRERRPIRRALLLGVADEKAPNIAVEVRTLETKFPDTKVFINSAATVEVLQREASSSDLVHLACHAQFRTDDPHFSSVRLSDGWFTVSEANKLKLSCELVTLSACDTGINAISPGEELIGLARGFLAAGTPSILLSLWTVDDETTTELMFDFYSQLSTAGSMADALRKAQTRLIGSQSHPFFWSPFMLVGRW